MIELNDSIEGETTQVCQPDVYRYRRSVLRKPHIDSGTGRRRMRLESVAKFHSPKSPMMSDSPRATASDSLSGTDVISYIKSHIADTATNINLNIIDMAVELEMLKGATLNGVTANIFVETFTNLNDINLMNGVYDSTNKRLVL